MKKFFLIFAMVLGVALTANAQPRAIGGRLGYNLDVSYQHNVGSNFVEIDAGIAGWGRGVHTTVLYDFIFAQPTWTSKGTWNFYAGPGVHLGYLWFDYHAPSWTTYSSNWPQAFVAGVAGQIGMSYTFWFPLQLSVDYRPVFGVALGEAAGGFDTYGKPIPARFHIDGLFDLALSVRYAF